MGQTTMRKGLGDWAKVKDAAMGSGTESSMDIASADTFNGTEQSGTLDFLAHHLRLNPRAAETGVIDKLNTQIDTLMARSYGDIDEVVIKFFEKVESYSKMEPAELERTILTIQKAVYVATDTVVNLYQDAYFADRVQQDEYWQAYKGYEAVKKPSIADRQAFAYEKSRDSRFYYYYVFLTWRKVSEKLSSLKDLQRTLEYQRNRTSREAKAW